MNKVLCKPPEYPINSEIQKVSEKVVTVARKRSAAFPRYALIGQKNFTLSNVATKHALGSRKRSWIPRAPPICQRESRPVACAGNNILTKLAPNSSLLRNTNRQARLERRLFLFWRKPLTAFVPQGRFWRTMILEKAVAFFSLLRSRRTRCTLAQRV